MPDMTIQQAFDLAVEHHKAGQFNDAEAIYRQILAAEPRHAGSLHHLGLMAYQVGRKEIAVDMIRQAIALRPDSPDAAAHSNLGAALRDMGQLDEAITAYRQAIAIQPDLAELYNNLGTALCDTGQLDAAIVAYRDALALKPSAADIHSNLVYTLHFHPDFDTQTIAEEHKRWNQQHAEPLAELHRPHANSRDSERRLRVGYVSPDFYSQAESHFIVPLFEAHDHYRFEIHAYASVNRPDLVTDRLRSSVSVWHDVLGYSNEELAEKIRHDGIDILVDLTMHMRHNRLPLFARKPAPVQVTWLAYPGSTGLETIDYRITDSFQDPPSSGTEGYSEHSVRLQNSWCCYDPLSKLLPAPVQAVHEGGFVLFGSLNNFCKLNESILSVWARVLAAVPGSRLLLLSAAGSQRDYLRRTFEMMGIEVSRIEFTGRCSREEYLRLYDRIDIAFDPLPYNGITTTLDALWMGVPVVSLTGNTAAGRVGLSLLSTLGLPDLATTTPEEFVRVATQLARDRHRLTGLRESLRARMEKSPLMDAQGFAREMETAYRNMWRKWCGSTQIQGDS